MIYRFIEEQCHRYPLTLLCSLLEVSRSGFYAWRRRRRGRPSQRSLSDRRLLRKIRRLHRLSGGVYGSPRIWHDLRERKEHVGRKRVARLMRAAGLQGVYDGPRFRTNGLHPTWEDAGNILDRRFAPGALSAWAMDLTYLRTGEGPLCLAVVLDVATRRVLGWATAVQPQAELSLQALDMALQRERPLAGTLLHSDRGGQFVSGAFRQRLTRAGLQQSLSRRGDCYDNAIVESLFSTVKRECWRKAPATRAAAKARIEDYLSIFYNRRRRHSSLKYKTPEVYAKELNRATLTVHQTG
jgi:transposase InsO family protein